VSASRYRATFMLAGSSQRRQRTVFQVESPCRSTPVKRTLLKVVRPIACLARDLSRAGRLFRRMPAAEKRARILIAKAIPQRAAFPVQRTLVNVVSSNSRINQVGRRIKLYGTSIIWR